MDKYNARFQMLALSGGGFRGLYTAAILEDFEHHHSSSLASHFDLLAGTSVGGIIALALACEIPAQTIRETLEKHGAEIFQPYTLCQKLSIPRLLTKFTLFRGLFRAKHKNDALKTALTELFDDKCVRDLKHRVIIPTVNWTTGLPKFFKTPHNPKYTHDASVKLVDVAMATSAAPIYFPNYKFGGSVYVDGGLVGNAPGLFALHEAESNIPDVGDSEKLLLAIGTMSTKITPNQNESVNRGLINWGEDLFSLILASQEGVTDYMLQQKMGSNYYKIDDEMSPKQNVTLGLDIASQGAAETLNGMGKEAAKKSSSNRFLQEIFSHKAPSPTFYTSEDKES